MAWNDAFSTIGAKLDELADKASPIENVRNDAAQANYNSQMANYKENAKSKEPLVQEGNKKPQLLRYAKGGEVKLNFKNFHKLHSDEHSTTLQHPDGHEIKIAHKALNDKMKKEIDALPHYAEGGDVSFLPQWDQQRPAVQEMADQPMDTESAPPPEQQPISEQPSNVAITPPQQQVQLPPQPNMGPMENAINMQEQGIQGQANVEAELGRKEAKITEEHVKNQQALMQDFQQNFAKLSQERENFTHDIQNSHIDPNRYMKNMSTGAQVGTAIGLLLGGIGGGMLGQENPAMKVLQQNIDRDVESQKADLHNKESLLHANMQQFGNLHDAMNMTRVMITDAYANKIAQAAAQSKSPMAIERAKQEIGKLRGSVAPLQMQTAQRQTVMNGLYGGRMAPEMAIPSLVPPEHQKEVYKEVERAQNTKHMAKSILQAFDDAAKDVRPMSGGRIKNLIPGTESAYVGSLHQAMQPTFQDLEGTVRQAAMDNTFANVTPKFGNSDREVAIKRKALEDYLQSKASAPTARSFGIDLSKFPSTAPMGKVKKESKRTSEVSMPVLVNKESGAAENVAPEQVQASLQTHDVPLIDPEGNHVTAPYEEASSLLEQGYTQPKTEQLKDLLDYTKFGTPTEMAKTAAEGAASGATFGLSTLAEKAMGVNPEDIRKREEVNPNVHTAGEIAGFAASAASGLGAGALAESLGAKAAEKVLAMAGASTAGRIGSQAVKFAAENALFQSGSEASKLFAGDPQQSMETAAAHIGLAGLMGMGAGAAFKGAGELWNVGPGKRLGQLLEGIVQKTDAGEAKTMYDPFMHKEMQKAPELISEQSMPALSKAIEKIMDKVPESAGALIGTLTGTGPIAGYITGKLAKSLGSESLEAVKAATLKFLGGSGAVDAAGFKAAAMVANAVIKGEKALSDSSAAVFGMGSKAISMPDSAMTSKLDKQLMKVANEPAEQQLQQDSKIQHYAPDHATAVSFINTRAQAYLHSIKPGTDPAMPLDSKTTPNAVQDASYQNALKIAAQPLYVMNSIKEGSLTMQEMMHLQGMYPELYKRMQQKLGTDLVLAKSKGQAIPYKTRLSLSTFLGQPLETSMTPMAIMANQMHSPNSGAQSPKMQTSSSKIMKLPQSYATPDQARQAHRQK